MRRYFYFLFIFLAITGCRNGNRFTIKGKINGEKEKSIYLNRIEVDYPVFIDSASIDKKGNFSFKVDARYPEFYQLGYSTSNFITILAEPGEKIDLVFNDKNLFKNYTVRGSKGSEDIRMLDQWLADTKRKLDSIEVIYKRTSAEPGFEERKVLLETDYENIIREQRKKNIDFIISNTRSFSSIKALYQKIDEASNVLYEPRDLQYYKIVSDSLQKYYPGSKQVQALKQDFDKGMSQFNLGKILQLADTIREVSLDPNLEDINGKRITLSSLRGKYVLLTFWSLSSRESVAENLQLKELYRLYNSKGFEIYQINLDQDEEVWRTAVKYDELPWISTREDNPMEPLNARLYNVKKVPTNYLYDKEGEIIATDLHGRSLQIKLNQLFGN